MKCKGISERSKKSIGMVDGYNVYIGSRGYALIVFGRSNEKLLHVYLAEKHLGRSLKGKIVHHADGNRLNNSPANLVVLENDTEHRALHARLRILGLGGDPDRQKYCPRCKVLYPKDFFYSNRGLYDKLDAICKDCRKKSVRQFSKRGTK